MDYNDDPIVAWLDIEIERRRNAVAKGIEKQEQLRKQSAALTKELYALIGAREVFTDPHDIQF